MVGLPALTASVLRVVGHSSRAIRLVVTFIAMKLVFALFWPSLEYNVGRYVVRDHDLLVQHGVLFRRRSSTPQSNPDVCHATRADGAHFGLSRLIVFMAEQLGGRRYSGVENAGWNTSMSCRAAVTMASDEDDKTPLPEDPTDIFIRLDRSTAAGRRSAH